jgi:hypothetical protein
LTTHAQGLPYSRPQVLRDPPTLVMTDHLIVLALMLATFWVLDPFRVSLDRITGVKHFPFFVLMGTLVLSAVGSRLFPRAANPVTWKEIRSVFWPIGLFILVVLAGSFFARFKLGIVNTFLNMGLLMLVIPLMARLVGSLAQPARWCRNYFIAVGLVAAWTGVLEWIHFGKGSYIHGAEFIVIPVLVYLWFARIPMALKIPAVLLFASFGIACHKNTGYLVLLFSLCYCVFWSLRTRYSIVADPLVRERYLAVWLYAGLGLLVLLVAFFLAREYVAASGNLEYRMHTYEKALTKFLASPIYGNAFSGPSTEKFELFDVMTSITNVLPTHSDPLDILANGGAVFSLLFMYGIIKLTRVLVVATDAAPNSTARDCLPALHACAAVFLSGLITMTFNPVMTQPNCALTLWTTTGIGLGLALYIRKASHVLG